MTLADHTVPPPGTAWTFDQAVADVFDDMLRRSIPDLSTMRELVLDLGSRFVQPDTFLVALGCSRGDDLAPFLDRFGAANRYLGLDSSEPMVEASRQRFAGFGPLVDIRLHDIARDRHPRVPVSLTLAVLVLMFAPVEVRSRILRDVFLATLPGGALVVVEKLLGSDEAATDLMTSAYRDLKLRNGYTEEEVEAKAAALSGVLVPWPSYEVEYALRVAGFRTVEPFWRAYNFAGFLAIRDSDG